MSRRSPESVREGNRWIDNPPSSGEFREWFQTNVKLHDGLRHDDYVGGIVVLPQKEKSRRTVDGQIVEEERLTFSPYPQVDTRVRYFWDWAAHNGYTGEISAVPRAEASKTLPPEVWSMTLDSQRGPVVWLNATWQVQAYHPEGWQIFRGPLRGTKTVELYGRYGPDVNAIMRAQTGAQGRALGLAGMLVLPGSGISSAEDIQDAQNAGGLAIAPDVRVPPPSVAEPHTEPAPSSTVTAETQRLYTGVAEALEQLKVNHADVYRQVTGWAAEREIDLGNPTPDQLPTLQRHLVRKLDQATRSGD